MILLIIYLHSTRNQIHINNRKLNKMSKEKETVCSHNTKYSAKHMIFDMQDSIFGPKHLISPRDTSSSSYLRLPHRKNSCRGSRRPALRTRLTDSCGSGSVACARRCPHPCPRWRWHRGSACPCLQPGRVERMLWC